MFHKIAYTTPLGVGSAGGDRLVRTADAGGPRSYYLDGAAPVDVAGMLRAVADRYAVSPDPKDYIFEAIRANTVQPPNDNNDGFTRAEMLRHDLSTGRPVYATYVGKPHHVNHKTDNPKAARGALLDAHYNDDAPVLDTCPRCAARTAERRERDASGLHCKCGQLVADHFVEVLTAIDMRKDPDFADGVRRGVLASGSMGCNCESTSCNVCAHVAFSRPDFCHHIKGGSKGSLWMSDGRGDWRRITPAEAKQRIEHVGWVYDPQDFCWADLSRNARTAAGILREGQIIARAFEYCNDVIFDEYSRVDTPADPKARQREVFTPYRRAAALTTDGVPTADELRRETQAMLAAAQRNGRTAQVLDYVLVRVNGDNDDVHAGSSVTHALQAARPDPGAKLEVAKVSAANAIAAAAQARGAAWSPLNAADYGYSAGLGAEGDVTIAPPPGERVIIDPGADDGAGADDGTGAGGDPAADPAMLPPTMPPPGAPPSAPGGGQSIEQYTNQQVPGMPQAPQGRPPQSTMSPAEMGIVPPGASAPRAADAPSGAASNTPTPAPAAAPAAPSAPVRTAGVVRIARAGAFADAYGDWTVNIVDGASRLESPDRRAVLMFPSPGTDRDAQLQQARTILAHVLDQGLVATAERFGGSFTPHTASVVDGGQDDMAEFDDHDMVQEVAGPDPANDMADALNAPPGSVVDDASDTMRDHVRGTPPGAVTDDATADHERPHDAPDGVAGEDSSNMRDKRTPPNLRTDTVLSGETHDHQVPLGGGKRKSKGALGDVVTHDARGGRYTIVEAAFSKDAAAVQTYGNVSYLLEGQHADGRVVQLRVGQADLARLWSLCDLPSPAAAAAAARTATGEKCGECGKTDCKEASHKKTATSVAAPAPAAAPPDANGSASTPHARWAAAQVARVRADADAAVAAARAETEAVRTAASDAAVAAFVRALRIAAFRGLANTETSPLRTAAVQVLSMSREVGANAATGVPLVVEGADPRIAEHLAAAVMTAGYLPDLERLCTRAQELMAKGDAYLLDAEADLQHAAAFSPSAVLDATAGPAFDEAALRAAELRRQAGNGNFQFMRGEPPPNREDRRARIRGALNGATHVTAQLARLTPPGR